MVFKEKRARARVGRAFFVFIPVEVQGLIGVVYLAAGGLFWRCFY